MWFIGKTILSYLKKENLDSEKKEKIVSRFKKILINEIKKIPEEEIVNYLFDSEIPVSVKKLISEEINTLSKETFSIYKKRFKNIVNAFKRKKLYKEEYLIEDYYPNEFKKIIIDNIYRDTPINLIYKDDLPLQIKKIIIDLKLSIEDAITLLSKDLSNTIKDYIIEYRINSVSDIDSCLYDKKMPDELKEKIITLKVNKENVFKVLRFGFGDDREKVYRLKSREIEDIINELTEENILSIINDYDTPNIIVKKIVSTKIDTIIKAITNADKKQIEDTLISERTKELVDFVIEKRKDTAYEIIKELNSYQLLRVLNREYLPDYLKEYLISQHESKIKEEIKKLTKSEIDLYYVRSDSHLPLSIQKMIFEEHKSTYIKEINEYSEEQFLRELKYYRNSDLVVELMIDLRINKDNIFKLLSDEYIRDSLIDVLLKQKKDIIREYLEEQEPKNLFSLKRKKLPIYIRNRIIEENKDLVSEKIKDLDENLKYESLNDSKTLTSIKKIILESFCINELDIDICVDLLNQGNAKLLLENFNNIKEFIINTGIDFESFLQYGSGSKKHSNWLINLTNIINNDLSNEFIKCKDYFFNNYYDEYNEKENTVYLISNFLELIDNFNKYHDLCINLESNRINLSNEDKLNISFLFNINNVVDIQLPKSLEELSEFKSNIYQEYINMIKDGRLNEYEIKNIFNDLLFCNANTILNYIGGTGALRTLKKDNSNSKSINSLVDELMLYSTIIEMVNDTNNKEGLKKVLEYTFSDIDALTKMQNLFSQFEKKVSKLYELDSKNNLTSLEKNRGVEGVINLELSEKYGGEVYDFSDKNYALYAHVLSRRENVESLINGEATGKSNFISVSPISYRGQRYYWGKSELIFAFDKIPNGSFVCSSISNMGSNGNIQNNSSEVTPINRKQRGILETSAVTTNNSEALLYRERLKPCGLILPGGREPTSLEMEYHKKYNLPFIITQEIEKAIENPKMVLKREDDHKLTSMSSKELNEIINILRQNVNINKETNEYTGREVAIFTDCHSMYEPTIAVLEDIRRRGIDEIYSLGDNVGLGPNPSEVFDLLEEYNVKSVAGNSEYYNVLGLEPFPYFYKEKVAVQEWTEKQLGPSRINKLKVYPSTIELILGNQKIALCHFINDVRWDFLDHSTHTYQANFDKGNAAQQFLYTNSPRCKKKIDNSIRNKKGDPTIKGYESSKIDPLFGGKLVTEYDAVIQGHVHFELEDQLKDTKIHTLRAVGMGYGNDKNNTACYYILKERKDGKFDIEKELVNFNRNSLLSSIYTSDLPSKELVLRYVKPKKDNQ